MTIWIRFDPYPASEQQGIIYKFQINDHRYVFMFSNRYDGMRDLINNADEDVDCITSATVPKGCREVDVFLVGGGVQDIMEAVEVAAILKPSKKIHPDGETVMLSLLHRVSQFR